MVKAEEGERWPLDFGDDVDGGEVVGVGFFVVDVKVGFEADLGLRLRARARFSREESDEVSSSEIGKVVAVERFVAERVIGAK